MSYPDFASAWLPARPIPRAPPVTIATFAMWSVGSATGRQDAPDWPEFSPPHERIFAQSPSRRRNGSILCAGPIAPHGRRAALRVSRVVGRAYDGGDAVRCGDEV